MKSFYLVLVIGLGMLCHGCASDSRYISEAKQTPSGENLKIAQSDKVLSMTLDHLVIPDGPGSWVKQAVWDEYQLTFRNLSNNPVTIERIRLVDSRGIYIDRGISPRQLVTMSEALMKEYRDLGIVTAITAAPTLMIMGGGLGAATAATALLPVTLIAAPVYYFSKRYMDQKDEESITGEFNRKNIGTLTFGSQATYMGSAFFPLVPNPASLVVDYRQGSQNSTLTLPLDTLHGLHVADQKTAAVLENLNSTSAVSQQPAAPATAVSEPTITKGLILAAQKKLNELGYEVGAADGVAGKRTQEAIAKFQTSKSLNITGTLNSQTLSALGL